VIDHRPVWQTLLHVPKLFNGRIGFIAGVSMTPAAHVEITSTRQVVYHVDGEPFVGGVHLKARAHAGALRIQAPAI
jgi:diacylglycerol kinase family enzyme